jgi:catechol 2,3-dioxygenase-like lactoylglutathione lyase family enzyme
MSIQLNHTIVWCRDEHVSSQFFAEILGLPAPRPFGIFQVVTLANGISLDFHATQDPITAQHYAFLISESEFDASFARIVQRRLDYWADPACRRPGEINDNDGGRGLYFLDPDRHFLEIITRPYGGHG